MNLFKVTNRSTSKGCKICSKLTIKKPKQGFLHCSGVFFKSFSRLSFVDFEQANVCWVGLKFYTEFEES